MGVRAGEDYVDVGTFDGYRRAIELLRDRADAPPPERPDAADINAIDDSDAIETGRRMTG